MHQSLRSALPSLRPVSPANIESTRDSLAQNSKNANPRFSSDFEVNRSLFVQHIRNKILPPTKPKLAPRSTQVIEKQTSEKSQPIPPVKKVKIEEEPTVIQETTSTSEIKDKDKANPYLKQVQDLFERIPTGKDPIPLDDVYRLSPVLDRVLCIVSEWSPSFIRENLDHPIINELQQRLFNLIDIDDFLIRTIICRILLSFAIDQSSPLLLPISRIFYKLSCDQSNDRFFEEEQLIPVLINLIKISQPDARVFSAGAIRNISACENIRNILVDTDFLQLAMSIFDGSNINENEYQPLGAQLLGALKQLCKNDAFKAQIAESHFLIKAARIVQPMLLTKMKQEATSMFIDILKIVCLVPDLSSDEKIQFINLLNEMDLSDLSLRRFIARSLSVLSVDIDSSECAKLVIKLLLLMKNENEFLYFLLAVAFKLVENKENVMIFQNQDEFFVDIVKSQEYDSNICLSAYKIVRSFQGDKYKDVLHDYSILQEIESQS